MKPPEFARPAAIEDLHVENGPDDILLSWQRPSTYTDNSRMIDLGEFRIERASGELPEFVEIAVLPVTDRERFRQIKRFRFADRGVITGARYRYRVVSATIDGYSSAPSNTVEIERQPRPLATPAAAATPKE